MSIKLLKRVVTRTWRLETLGSQWSSIAGYLATRIEAVEPGVTVTGPAAATGTATCCTVTVGPDPAVPSQLEVSSFESQELLRCHWPGLE